MTSNLRKRISLRKPSWFCLTFLISFLNFGCVTIRDESPNGKQVLTHCGMKPGSGQIHDLSSPPGKCCELCEQHEFKQPWENGFNPVRLVPNQITGWTRNQFGRCKSAKASVQDWIQSKKEEANAPPWPRFHSIPTKPAFETDEEVPSATPGTYGRFGKG